MMDEYGPSCLTCSGSWWRQCGKYMRCQLCGSERLRSVWEVYRTGADRAYTERKHGEDEDSTITVTTGQENPVQTVTMRDELPTVFINPHCEDKKPPTTDDKPTTPVDNPPPSRAR